MYGARFTWDAHAQRSCGLGLLLAEAVVPADVDDPQLSRGFLLHDIGKLAIPPAILDKPGPLTDVEYALVRTHPRIGWGMLDGTPDGGRTRDVVLFHHERWDGGGYPHGLRGEQIPLWARIFAIADAFEAMTGERPYRRALSASAARDEVRAQSGSQFDPGCVEPFLALDAERVGGYVAAARSVASKSVRAMGPTHGDVVPALR